MKDRVFIVLSWVALAHALVVLAGVLDGMNNSLPIPTTETVHQSGRHPHQRGQQPPVLRHYLTV